MTIEVLNGGGCGGCMGSGGGYRRPAYRRRRSFSRKYTKKSYRKKRYGRYGRRSSAKRGNAPLSAIRRYGVTPVTEQRAAKHYDVLRERAEKYRVRVTQAMAYAQQKAGGVGAGVKTNGEEYANVFSQASDVAQGMASMANAYQDFAHGEPAMKTMRFSSSNITTFNR